MMANHGGKRAGAGRPPKTLAKMMKGSIDPLDYLAEVMNDEKAAPHHRIDAAKALTPFRHHRLRAKHGWVMLNTLPSPVKSMKVYQDRLYVCTAKGVWTYGSVTPPTEELDRNMKTYRASHPEHYGDKE